MASHRIEESALSDLGHIPYAVPHMIHPPTGTFINQGPAFDFGELEEAIMLQAVNDTKQPLYPGRPAATLEMFPSWPMRFHHTPRGSSKSGEESADSGSAVHSLSSRGEGSRLEPESPVDRKGAASSDHQVIDQMHHYLQLPQQVEMANASNSPRTRMSQPQPLVKPTSEKSLRRLAQNREAAKKSRLRKKAYVQQLESSRVRLSQLEQDLQRARSQGIFIGGSGGAGGNISSGAAIFDMEYARWLDDDHRHMIEIRTALQAQLSDADLRVILGGYMTHYDEIFHLKGVAAKSDVFHLINGTWATPAERCFLWMAGFRPSELIKMLSAQLDLLTEQQLMGIYSLQRSTEQAEEALSQGLEQLQQSLNDTIAGGSINDSTHHIAIALGKLTNLEGFVRQADNLRQRTLHQLHRVLTVRQAARCFLVIGEYYGRLRALSSLWASRPREALIGDDISCQTTTNLQMVHSSQNHLSNF
ncbi:unnamed protein product [Fraxinus pennsylvanica]|uniref:Uncharacterized protein n=1 Tax=Fraxinus pennsylvanica TaxID=56036 RepID=A0AAD2E4E6_9LAMI|nr:unnamed protein product [Fraxinus pennsylvanica]